MISASYTSPSTENTTEDNDGLKSKSNKVEL